MPRPEIDPKMTIDIEAIRDRADRAAPGLENIFHKEYEIRPVRASARDVPALLAEIEALVDEVAHLRAELEKVNNSAIKTNSVIDTLRPLLVAALVCAQIEDVSALERLVEEADKLPWKTMDALGLKDDDD